ncbi:hypothetical protein SFRURICE_001452 [Spodoptera frugiperda]|uniref:SFRICE_018130 n=1 Tax=Spodoptera frugiperda TaxID=7108 RepID=A0A2H1VUS5_SPOFR|nr:hypothetical protein SFRURICE_001452 [Spodoptera frugiperda]
MAVGRRNVSMMRLGRCIAFLAAAAFLLPFTILLMVADQQYNLTYSSKRVFYQEVCTILTRLNHYNTSLEATSFCMNWLTRLFKSNLLKNSAA